jgi:hypothetical protein
MERKVTAPDGTDVRAIINETEMQALLLEYGREIINKVGEEGYLRVKKLVFAEAKRRFPDLLDAEYIDVFYGLNSEIMDPALASEADREHVHRLIEQAGIGDELLTTAVSVCYLIALGRFWQEASDGAVEGYLRWRYWTGSANTDGLLEDLLDLEDV